METLDIGGWVRRVHAPTKQEDRTSDGKKGGKRKRRENEKKKTKRERLLNTAWKDQFYTVRSEKNVAEIVLVVFR